MKKVGVFYGSSTGNTQSVAETIVAKLGIDKSNLFDVSNTSVDKFAEYDVLILGSSTWGVGDLQDDWEGLASQLGKSDLSGKIVAVFGVGDSSSYPDTFCDAVGILAEEAEKAGATLVGSVDSAGYSFDDSRALSDGEFRGLVLDIDNEDDQTAKRVAGWIEKIKSEAGI
ncbi:MAG: flavodoxin [Dysgonamonadaceae bacterium]|jgi:flavodoxin I|nr:flavodoxin [Dysgonamonadaceae bacterium]